MQPAEVNFNELKERMRGTWMAGDFGQIARYAAHEGEEFVGRRNIVPGMRVLDVACGTGNLALPAARRGAEVTGVDIAPNLLAQARKRAEEEGLKVQFDEGDAEQLPYPDASFDLVMSMFGAMFAPRPQLAAKELMRVCRPGGLVAMANWTPEGFVGHTFRLTAQFVPPPSGIPAPVLWGDEQTVRERLGGNASKLELNRREFFFDFPLPPRDVVRFFREYFGPTQMAFARLDDAGKEAFAAATEALWREHNEAGGESETRVRTEYLEVLATRA